MSKVEWKPGNMLYPIPAVMVSVRGKDGVDNIFTVGWVGTVCTNPPMLSISVRPERHSYEAIMETGEFVVNLTTEALAKATDFCGVRSGREYDKFAECHLTKEEASHVSVSMIQESPVNIECRVKESRAFGSHTMFIADVVAVHVEESYMDETGKFRLEDANPIVYSHGTYLSLGQELGTFGYSVRKPVDQAKREQQKKKPRWKKSKGAKKRK